MLISAAELLEVSISLGEGLDSDNVKWDDIAVAVSRCGLPTVGADCVKFLFPLAWIDENDGTGLSVAGSGDRVELGEGARDVVREIETEGVLERVVRRAVRLGGGSFCESGGIAKAVLSQRRQYCTKQILHSSYDCLKK